LEVYNPSTDALVTRWDLDVVYDTVGGGSLWVDTDAVRYAIRKAGLVPSTCSYALKLMNSAGRPDVAGWAACKFRSTDALKRFSAGATIGGHGITTQTAYWSR
jgi:hypothetical protein